MNIKKWLAAGLSVALAGCLGWAVAACAPTEPNKPDDSGETHTHTYDAWDYNETQHWKYCDEHGTDKSNIDETTRANHTFVGGTCECGATEGTTPGGEVTEGDWVIGEDGTVTKWNGTGTELTLPKTVKDVEVKKIAATTFADNANAAKITKLTVGYFKDGFNFLESGALDALTGCTEVIYNEEFETSTNSVIYNQKTFLAHIKKVTFNENVLNTPQAGCANMTALESVEFKGAVQSYRANLFANTPLTEITIPASLTTWQCSAFEGMKKLETINYALTRGNFMNFKTTAKMHPFDDVIGSEAEGGVKLVITNPEAVIGENTFYGFTHLKSIEWHKDGMKQIYAKAFAKSGVTSLTIPANFTEDTLNKMNNSGAAFEEMESLETLTFEPNPQYHVLPSNSFLGCTSLRKVVLPEGVTGLTSWTFRRCTSLREVVLPSTLTKLSYQAFFEDTLDSLTIKKADGVLTFSPNTATNAGLTFSADGKIYVPADLVDDYKADTNWKLLEQYIEAAPEVDPDQKLTVNWYIKGTDEPAHTQEVTSGETLNEEDAFTPDAREGFTFYGWYSDENCTKKVDFPVEVLEAKNFYGEFRENIELDQRDYFLVGNGQGTIKASKWALGASAPASCKFTRDPGTNTYRINNFELYVGDQMKLGFASKWGATNSDSNYAFGAYFFSKTSDVFEKSSAWDDNAKVADGKSGKYNIILVTKGANTSTTAKAETQIVSFTFELVESYNVVTEDMGWYLTGAMNSWNDTAPNPLYKLTETSEGSGIWEGTFNFPASYKMKAIHFTKTTKGSTVSYASNWSNDSDHTTPSGNVKMSYNSKTDKLTHTTVTAAAAPVALIPDRKH